VVPGGPCKTSWTTYRTELLRFSLTDRSGASEKCTKANGDVHIAFTTFPQARKRCKRKEICKILRKIELLRNYGCGSAPKWCRQA
jgi:hypothetical protein